MPQCKSHHWVPELLATAFDLLCLLLVKKTKFVVGLGYLTPSESCRGILWETAATVWRARLGFSFRSVAGELRVPHLDCCRLLTGDDGLLPCLLLLILLVWQAVACEILLRIANSIIKSTRSIQSSTTVTKISMQTIVTIAGSVEPAESSTIAGSAKGYSTRGSCEDTGPLWHRHVFQSSFGSLAGRKKDEANVPVSTCSMPASSSSTRRPRGPGARMDQNVYVSMTTLRVRSTRRKTLPLQDRPRFELGNKQKSLWGKKIYPAAWWVLGLPLVAA